MYKKIFFLLISFFIIISISLLIGQILLQNKNNIIIKLKEESINFSTYRNVEKGYKYLIYNTILYQSSGYVNSIIA